eukprot:Gregarina_sp_Pseudo_9__5630@NODE_780_length_2228_cov_15_807675_g734_i0_p1_GENE_NODE_780_length_2228_cov_15_807675_g734_i0NODE_780_length_2228_cov_15_807675_g734_i0_p1_ORF_typecomplete_len568_score150_18Sugar_tr/PF00083_24/1_6e87MFS_1/PF07690_16/2_7e13MFS_1/PF07690_16/5_6e08TRI12/PF06609_13/4_8e06TRI12/PF06609_13/2_5e03TRI12/PF06609_13/27MFS_3/PF05977_13/3_2e03MFS_3/PF05977_13/0_0073MFS_3/PF05977_13/0_0017DUF5357/PF17310_2/0_085_NODE_780_length_2228_cov_15_807675_g734_i03212024
MAAPSPPTSVAAPGSPGGDPAERADGGATSGDRNPDPAGILRELLANEEGDAAVEVFNLDLMRMKGEQRQQWRPVPHTGRLVLVACCGTFLYGYSIAVLNPIIAWISWEFEWCATRETAPMGHYEDLCWLYEGLAVWMVFVGAAVGSVVASRALRGGRRGLMILSTWLHMLGCVSLMTAGSVASVSWARFLSGLGVGCSSVIAPIYLSEMTPHASRGLYGLFNQVSITLGVLLPQLLGLPLPFVDDALPTDSHSVYPPRVPGTFVRVWWRVLCGLPFVPALACLHGLFRWFPYETPHWYLRVNRVKEARAVLQHVYSKDDVSPELEGMAAEVQAARASARASLGFRQALRRPELRKVVLIGCVVSSFQQFTGINVFVSGTTEILRQAGWSGAAPLAGSCGIWGANVLFTIPSFWLVERASRRMLIIVGCAGMALSLAPATVGYWLDENQDLIKWGSLFGQLVFVCFFACTFGPILWVYIFEIFPVEIKGTSFSLVTLVAHWIACLFAVGYGRLVTNVWVFTIFAALNLIIAIVSAFLVKEPKSRSTSSPYNRRTFISGTNSLVESRS